MTALWVLAFIVAPFVLFLLLFVAGVATWAVGTMIDVLCGEAE